MFEEYKKELLESYFLKKSQKQLSNNLESPARLKLKKECLKIFRDKYTKSDDEMLKAFFDPLSKFNDHIKSIERFELDKFRPLVNFLQKGTNIRDEESVKLLAWLIDFEPYRNWRCKDDSKGTDVPPGITEGEPEGKSEGTEDPRANEPQVPDQQSGWSRSIKRTMIFCITLFAVAGTGFFLSGGSRVGSVREPLSDEKCMYWTGEHYEPIKCDKSIKHADVMPLNLEMLYGLRRINATDTLTKYSLGKVWYSKIRGKHEFFTDSGTHPVEPNKRLKPLTNYILSNYVSYHRYLLTRLVWSIGIGIIVAVSIGMVYLFRRKNRLKSRIGSGMI